jgi:hypothetical protein
MANIVPVPLVMKDCLVKVATDNYEAALSGVTLTPTTPTFTFSGLTPTAKYTAAGNPDWLAAIDYVQDWDTVGSFSNYLHANQGKTVSMEFTPKAKSGKKFTVDVTIIAGAIGGAGGALASTSVSLPAGTPVVSAAATA